MQNRWTRVWIPFPPITSVYLFLLFWVLFPFQINARRCELKTVRSIICYDRPGHRLSKESIVTPRDNIYIKVKQISEEECIDIKHFLVLLIPPSDGTYKRDKQTEGQYVVTESSLETLDTIINLPPSFLDKPGPMVVRIFRFDDRRDDVFGDGADCEFVVELLPPVANMLGGTEKLYPSDKENFVKCDALDMNRASGKTDYLSFTWSCSVLKGSGPEVKGFCSHSVMDKFKNRTAVLIPAGACKIPYSYRLSVIVGSKLDPDTKKSITVTQEVGFYEDKDGGTLEIRCVKNCPPKVTITLPSVSVILQALLKGWRLGNEVSLLWFCKDIIDDKEISYDTLKNQEGPEFYLKPVALEKNKRYMVRVSVVGGPKNGMSAELDLATYLPPLPHCTLNPIEGTALKTLFSVDCSWLFDDVLIEVFSVQGKKASLLLRANYLGNEVFYLPAGSNVIVNVTYLDFGLTETVHLAAKVSNGLDLDGKSEELITETVTNKLDDALDSIKSGYTNLALQEMGALVSEYSKSNEVTESLKTDLDKKVASTLKIISLDKSDTAQKVVDTLSMVNQGSKKADPDLTTMSSEICMKARPVLFNDVKYAQNPEWMRPQTEHTVKSMASCSQVGLQGNPESVQTKNFTIIVLSTPAPPLSTQLPPEDYPDYVDDELSSDNIAKFEVAAQNMAKICFSNAKMITLTMVPEEDPVITREGLLDIVVGRMYCHEVPYRRVNDGGNGGLWVRPSRECFTRGITVVDTLMCSTKQNPYWYIDNISIITPVVFLKFSGSGYQRSTKKVDLPSYPFTVSLPINRTLLTEEQVHQAPIPDDKIISSLNEDGFYQSVSMHRIFVAANERFSLTFITDKRRFDVTLTHFEKPSYEYFKSHRRCIDRTRNTIHVAELHDYDSFWFLSVLPQVSMPSEDQSYSFSVSTWSCFTWNESSRSWQEACQALLEKESITCSCERGSIFTGYQSPLRVLPEPELLIVEFELQFKFCWIVFLATAVTFLVFLVVLFLTSFERPDNVLDRVFFVSDVPSTYHYGYILVVSTGTRKYAGTTSNVIVKLHGTQGDSLVHVLNYPDPDLVMLQKGSETWFVLATAFSLGELNGIEVWYDGVGYKTKWFCSKIDVYDVQNGKHWTFEADVWLDVMQEGKNSLVLAPVKQPSTKPVKTRQIKLQKVVTAVNSFLGKFGDEVNLWNFKRVDPILSRKERATLIFSMVLSMYLAIMFLFFVPRFDESDTIDPHNLGFIWKLIWTPVVGNMAIIPYCYLVHLIKQAKLYKKTWAKKLEEIAWAAVILIATSCLTTLTVSGFWVPFNSSLLWLVSASVAIMFNVIVVQNALRLFYGWFRHLPQKVSSLRSLFGKIMKFIELQRTFVYKRFGALALRPFLRHLYFPLDPIAEKERKKWEETKAKAKEILEDVVMITLYVSLLYVVLALDRDDQAVFNQQEVKNLLSGKMIEKQMDVKSVSDIESYISDTLLPSIQSNHWYGKYVQDNPGMTKDFSNKYLGIIRLRQHRTVEVPCKLPDVMVNLDRICRPDFGDAKEKRDFARGWVPINEYSNISTERMAGVWRYSDSSVTGSINIVGEYSIYPGGGYVAPLGRNLKNSLASLEYLKKHHWLDSRTRALFIEFLVYNPNVNLFNGVCMAFVVNSAGHIATEYKIQTRKLLITDKQMIATRNVIFLVFGLVIIALMSRITVKILKKKRSYFYDLWSLLDVLIVVLTFLATYLYLARQKRIQDYVSAVSAAKNNEFVNYFHLFNADNTLTTLSASLVFVATFRLWKLLRFMVIVKTAEKTIKDASLSLLLCLAYQLLFVVAFSLGGMQLFGGHSQALRDNQDFKNFRTALTNLLLLSLNLYPDFDPDALYYHPLGVTFYIAYMLVSFFFFNIYIAIISLHYADAKDFYSDEVSAVQKYLSEKWTYYKYLIASRARKLRGGEDATAESLLIIKPKSGERYEDCFAVTRERLDAMALATICVLRNLETRRQMTLEDYELMSKTIMALCTKRSFRKEMFFPTGDSRHITFVDDRKICQIADICEKLANFCLAGNRVGRGQRDVSPMERRIDRIETLIDNSKMLLRVVNNIEIR